MDILNKHICYPVCQKECENGNCTSPEVCTCNPGYQKDPSDKYKCLPVCLKECQNGECVIPETCRCNSGFTPNLSDPYLCDPFCEPGCVNAQCVKPNECECFGGYKKEGNDTSFCKPICLSGCQNGDCMKPEFCECWEGYEVYDKNSVCVPTCSLCQYGICVAPETCQCWSSYENPEDTNSTCVPVCDGGCSNSICSAPNECSCDEGFKNSTGEWNTCSPVCSKECINSNCTDPENCECFPGFEKDTIEENKCLPFCSDECLNGLCTDPEICTCLWGFLSLGNSSNCSIVEISALSCSFRGLMILSNESEEQDISPINISILSNLNDCVFLKMIHLKNLLYSRKAESVITLNCSSSSSDSEVPDGVELIFECEIETVAQLLSTIDSETSTYTEDSTVSSTYLMQYEEGSSVSAVDYYYDENQTNSLESDSTSEENDLTVSTVTGSIYEESFTTEELFEEVTQNSNEDPHYQLGVEEEDLHESNHLQNLIESDVSSELESFARFEYPSEDYLHDQPLESMWFENSTLEADMDYNSIKNTEDSTEPEDGYSSDAYFSTVSTDSESSLYSSITPPSDSYDIEDKRSTLPPSVTTNKTARKNISSFELIIKPFKYIETMKMTAHYFEKYPNEEISNSWCFCLGTTIG